jgi:hypothetical protein
MAIATPLLNFLQRLARRRIDEGQQKQGRKHRAEISFFFGK